MRGCNGATIRFKPLIRRRSSIAWAERAKVWAKGGAPKDLPLVDAGHRADAKPRDVFIYFIHEGQAQGAGRGHRADRAL